MWQRADGEAVVAFGGAGAARVPVAVEHAEAREDRLLWALLRGGGGGGWWWLVVVVHMSVQLRGKRDSLALTTYR